MSGNDAGETSLYIWIAGIGALFLFYRLVRPALDRRRWGLAFDMRPGALPMTVFSIMFMALFVPPLAIPAVVVAVAVHEYGHVLAFRMTGHPDPKFQLTPFGGVAYPGGAPRRVAGIGGAAPSRGDAAARPDESHTASFFIAMMGPGFSLALLVICLLASEALASISPVAASYAFQAAFWIGFINALNLLPVYPFDGGRAIQSIASIAGPQGMRGIMMVVGVIVTILAAFAAAILGMWFLLFICGLGLVIGQAHLKHAAQLPPMPTGDALLCLLTYAITVAALSYLSQDLFARYFEFVHHVASARLGF